VVSVLDGVISIDDLGGGGVLGELTEGRDCILQTCCY